MQSASYIPLASFAIYQFCANNFDCASTHSRQPLILYQRTNPKAPEPPFLVCAENQKCLGIYISEGSALNDKWV